MRKKHLIASVAIVVALMVPALAQREAPLNLQGTRGGKAITDHYIVVLEDGADARAVAQRHGVNTNHVYSAALNGFAAKLTSGQLRRLLRDTDVKYIDEDGVVQTEATATEGPDAAVVQPGAIWNLDRLDQPFGAGNDGNYNYTDTGAGVNIYVVDTGIRVTHNQFDGAALNRAKAGALGFDALGGNGLDCNGHGTHISGTIGGTTYGVAKAVKLYSVRVLDCGGSGSFANIIAGVDWVTNNHVKPAVAIAALGGGFNQALNDAVTKSISWGVLWVVPAGSSNFDACNISPASTPNAITVAVTDMANNKAAFSNFGPCVDIHAPGVNITSAWHTSDTATMTISGSMASAHIAGLAALYLAANRTAASGQLTDAIENSAVVGAIGGLPGGTPNLLAHKINGTHSGVNQPPGANCDNQEPDVFPSQCYYFTYNTGYHHVWLRGTPGTNFNVGLYRWNGNAWALVAQKTTASTNEYLKFFGQGGFYYMFLITSASGSGTYDSWIIHNGMRAAP